MLRVELVFISGGAQYVRVGFCLAMAKEGNDATDHRAMDVFSGLVVTFIVAHICELEELYNFDTTKCFK